MVWHCVVDAVRSPTGCMLVVTLLVIVLSRVLLSPNARRAPIHPKRDATKRKFPRGTGADLVCKAPGTGEVLGTLKAYTPADVANALAASRAAAEDGAQAWNKTSFEERRALLQDILDWTVRNQKEIIEMSVRDSGKTGQKSRAETSARQTRTDGCAIAVTSARRPRSVSAR